MTRSGRGGGRAGGDRSERPLRGIVAGLEHVVRSLDPATGVADDDDAPRIRLSAAASAATERRRALDSGGNRLVADEHGKGRRLGQRGSLRVGRSGTVVGPRPDVHRLARAVELDRGHSRRRRDHARDRLALLAQHDERVGLRSGALGIARRRARNPRRAPPAAATTATSRVIASRPTPPARRRSPPQPRCPPARRAARAAAREIPAPQRAALSRASNPPSGPIIDRERRLGGAIGRACCRRPAASTMPAAVPRRKPFGEGPRRGDFRDPVPARLLRGRRRHLAPMGDALFAALSVRQRRAPRGDERLDRRDAELGRLAHRGVHRIARDDRLRERERRAAIHARPAGIAPRAPAAPRLSARTSVAAYSPPVPSNIVSASPTARRRTRVAWCADASSSSIVRPASSGESATGRDESRSGHQACSR